MAYRQHHNLSCRIYDDQCAHTREDLGRLNQGSNTHAAWFEYIHRFSNEPSQIRSFSFANLQIAGSPLKRSVNISETCNSRHFCLDFRNNQHPDIQTE